MSKFFTSIFLSLFFSIFFVLPSSGVKPNNLCSGNICFLGPLPFEAPNCGSNFLRIAYTQAGRPGGKIKIRFYNQQKDNTDCPFLFALILDDTQKIFKDWDYYPSSKIITQKETTLQPDIYFSNFQAEKQSTRFAYKIEKKDGLKNDQVDFVWELSLKEDAPEGLYPFRLGVIEYGQNFTSPELFFYVSKKAPSNQDETENFEGRENWQPCLDQVDNDLNWLSDCFDKKCFQKAQMECQAKEVSPCLCPEIFLKKFACSDGLDNDGDGKIDFPNDPGCASPFDDDETDLLQPETKESATTTSVISETIEEKEKPNPLISFLDNPQVEEINKRYAAPALIGLAMANTLAATSFSLWPFLWSLFQYLGTLFTEPTLILTKRRRRDWGVVYNSLNKLPVDLALVRLYESQSNRLVQTKVTDRAGRYVFVVHQPGFYKIKVQKENFVFPSEILAKEKNDLNFVDLYHGETIEIKEKGEVLGRNIPLDPIVKEKEPREVLRAKRRLKMHQTVSLSGLALAVVSFSISPELIFALLLLAHLVLYFVFARLALGKQPKKWGIVRDAKTGKPIPLAIVKIFESQYNKLLDTQVTNRAGQYFFLVGKNKYYVTCQKDGYQETKSDIIDLSQGEAENFVALELNLFKEKEN